MLPAPKTDSREHFMRLYRDLYEHAYFLEESLGRLLKREKIDRTQLENHLSQMIEAIGRSGKDHLTLTFTRRGKKKHSDTFHNDMVRVTKVVRNQAGVLLKTSFLAEKSDPGLEFIQTLSNVHDNILVAFQHVLQNQVFLSVSLN